MSSTKKIAANRINSRRSRGPRTGAGKARASRNARRHGLAAFDNKDPAKSGRIKQMVDAICEGDDDPLLRERAVAIAEAQLWLSCIRTEKVAVLERLRDPEEEALTGRNTRRWWAQKWRKFNLNFRAFQIASAQLQQLEAFMHSNMGPDWDPEREPLPPHLEAIRPPSFLKRRKAAPKERDEYQVLRAGIRDLERLLRYEKRAWSRRKKAVRAFTAIKMMSP